MHRGYVKIWRKIQDWEWSHDLKTLGFFTAMVLKANHKDSRFQGYEIKRGSFVCGRRSLAREFKTSEQSIRTLLDRLKSTNEVTIKSTHLFSIISIANYEKYQENQPTNQPTNQPASNQRVTTSKECKNEKNTVVPTATREIFDHFRARFKTFRGVDLVSVWGKDMKTFKELLSQVDKDSLKGMIDEFFKSKDPFVVSSDYGVGVFRSQINKLNKPAKKTVWDTAEKL